MSKWHTEYNGFNKNKTTYRLFSWSKKYPVPPECLEKIELLDEQRVYVFGKYPLALLPMIFISAMLSFIFLWITKYDFPIIGIFLAIYTFLASNYYMNITWALKRCSKTDKKGDNKND